MFGPSLHFNFIYCFFLHSLGTSYAILIALAANSFPVFKQKVFIWKAYGKIKLYVYWEWNRFPLGET